MQTFKNISYVQYRIWVSSLYRQEVDLAHIPENATSDVVFFFQYQFFLKRYQRSVIVVYTHNLCLSSLSYSEKNNFRFCSVFFLFLLLLCFSPKNRFHICRSNSWQLTLFSYKNTVFEHSTRILFLLMLEFFFFLWLKLKNDLFIIRKAESLYNPF